MNYYMEGHGRPSGPRRGAGCGSPQSIVCITLLLMTRLPLRVVGVQPMFWSG
jgi:hypothetical protein